MNGLDWLFRKKFPVGFATVLAESATVILANGKEAPVRKLFNGCASHWLASLASSSNIFKLLNYIITKVNIASLQAVQWRTNTLFPKELWCCVAGRVRHGNLALLNELTKVKLQA